jgi:hypothetical protein
MSAVPASAAADNSDAVSPLSAGNGLSEAAKQYLLRYPPRRGGKPPQDTACRSLFVWRHTGKGMAGRGLGPRYRGRAASLPPSLNPRSDRDKQYLNTWLSLGYAVAPDYASLGSSGLHHYLNARGEAWSVLDSVRAALKQFPLKNELILVGQSQGARRVRQRRISTPLRAGAECSRNGADRNAVF